MPSNNPLKRALAEGKKQVGFWLSSMSPVAAEIAAGSGFDWLLIDMEHTGNEPGDVVHAMRAMVGGTAEPVVRVPWNEPVIVKRMMDLGARSFLFPYVENEAEAKAAKRGLWTAEPYPALVLAKGRRGAEDGGCQEHCDSRSQVRRTFMRWPHPGDG